MTAWWHTHPGVAGAAARVDEAFRLAAMIFGELLPRLLTGAAETGTTEGPRANTERRDR